MKQEQQTRLNKYLSEIGFCSRRKADKLIEEGRITVNGELPEMGVKVTGDEEIKVNGKKIENKNEKTVYLAFNKPVGVVCTTDTRVEKNNIVDFINYPTRIFPIGRLDKASEGLIFLTNDGDIVNKILRARNQHDKEYIVDVDKPIAQRFLDEMASGVPILDTVTRKCEVHQIGKQRLKIILTQGLNRQIRRMCEYLGYKVTHLKRVRIMNVNLDVPTGTYRYLTKMELETLQEMVSESRSVPTDQELDNKPSKSENQDQVSRKRRERE